MMLDGRSWHKVCRFRTRPGQQGTSRPFQRNGNHLNSASFHQTNALPEAYRYLTSPCPAGRVCHMLARSCIRAHHSLRPA